MSRRSVQGWRCARLERGEAAIASKASPGRFPLSETQIARLKCELDRSPLVHAWSDHRRALSPMTSLIGPLAHVRPQAEDTLEQRRWSWQQRRSIERHDDTVTVKKSKT